MVIITMVELDEKFYQSFPKAWANFPGNFSEYVDFKHCYTSDKNQQTTLNFCSCNDSYWVSYPFQNI